MMEDGEKSPIVKKPEASKDSSADSPASKRIDDLILRGHLIRNESDSVESGMEENTAGATTSLIGQQLTHYRIIQKLGSGGMGDVYLAEDTRLGRTVALKILPDFIAANQEGLKRFIREAKTASAVNHPNVAHVYEFEEQGSIHFIAMEYVEGETLFEKIAGRPLANSNIVRIAIQIADALKSAHSRGIIHRDIKTKNIMITPAGLVKVLDFGLAKTTVGENWNTATLPGIVVGTAPYMSPEQAKGEPSDLRTDLFSLGIVMYEMATGHLPFTGSRVSEIMEHIIQKTPDPVAQFNQQAPAELERIIFKCLEKQPENRYQNANELLADLQNLERYINSGTDLPTAKLTTQSKSISTVFFYVFAAIAVMVAAWYLFRPAKTEEQSKLHTISTFPGSHSGASFSPDGSMIAFMNDSGSGPQIWIKNLISGNPVQITFTKLPSSVPRWSPSNDRILFSSGSFALTRYSENIWTVPPLGGNPQKFIENGRNPNWSQDGKSIVFERNEEIWVANSDGGQQRKVEGVSKLPLLLVDRFPAFSPDSSKIVYFEPASGPSGDYWIISSAGGDPTRITFDDAKGGRAVWTPDGKFIIFPSTRAGSLTLWKAPASGGNPAAITTGAGLDSDPEISRDGKRLIFTNTKYTYTMKLYDTKALKSRDLLTTKHMVAPMFSEDGNKIAFFSNDHLFTINTTGADLFELTPDDGSNKFPRWSDHGNTIFFYQHKPTRSLRKVSATGGKSHKVYDNWDWEAEYGAQPDPSGERIVYSKRKEGKLLKTFVRDLKSGKEQELSMALDDPRWSRDGKWITGYTADIDESIYVCPPDGGSCRFITKGINPVWSGDNSQLYFQRKGDFEDGAQLWLISIDGSNERSITDLRPMLPIAFFYDVSNKDEVVWIQTTSGTGELWVMDLNIQ